MKTINVYDNNKPYAFTDEYIIFREQSRKISKQFLVIKRIDELNQKLNLNIQYTLDSTKSRLATIIFLDDKKYLEFLLRTSDASSR